MNPVGVHLHESDGYRPSPVSEMERAVSVAADINPPLAPQSIRVPFKPRGPLSSAVLEYLTARRTDHDLSTLAEQALAQVADIPRESIAHDDDIQLALFALYASAYGSIEAFSPDMEWEPHLIATRRTLEVAFEQALRATVSTPELPSPRQDDVARALFAFTKPSGGPSLSRYIAKKATKEHAREMMVQRSIYTLREADPHSWAIPRLSGRAKAALVEIQADEYGGGRPERVHGEIFARSMRGMGLDSTYGAYVDNVPAITLASHNLMSMFGLNRRLVGAIVGHLAAYEMTSSIPCRMYADGLRRLGFGESVTDYFDEHVEADAVHEQIAGRDLAGALAEDQPGLLADIMFGAAAYLTVDDWMGDQILEAWEQGRSSLIHEVSS